MFYEKTCFFVYMFTLILLNFVIGHRIKCTKKHNNNISKYENHYGSGYGTEWIYFPDGNEVPHYVDLTASFEDDESYSRGMYSEIEFKLYTRNEIQNFTILDEFGKPINGTDDVNVTLSNAPLKVITHGWRSSVEKRGLADITKAYLQTREVNVVTVDWSYTASSFLYHWVANQTFTIGTEVAIFLKSLNRLYNVSGNQIHLIGHSLGAHVMGVAALYSNLTVNRITGLDPAKPLFEYPSRENSAKLDASDAVFVDVIHTCGGLLGIDAAVGTADFYPNNGIPPQPGCNSLQKIIEACSHGRAIYYFAESIKNPKAFPAQQCIGWIDYLENRCDQQGLMGEGAYQNLTGKFYLKTNSIAPFGFGRS